MSPNAAIQIYATTQDPDAFRQLVEQYDRFVFSVCCRMLTRAEAEDATQDVFIKLMRNAGSIHDDVVCWLHRCAVNTCRDLIRKNQSRRRRESGYGKVQSSDSDETISLLVEVDEALLELSDEDRSLIVRYYLRRETQQELAAEIGVNQSTVKRKLDAALEKLRSILRKRGAVLGLAAIASVLESAEAVASAPELLRENLTKIGLMTTESASPASWTYFVGSNLKRFVLAACIAMAAVGGYFVVTRTSFTDDVLHPFGRRTAVGLKELPQQCFYERDFVLAESGPIESLVRQVIDQATAEGFKIDGPVTYLHPTGLGLEPEVVLRVAVPVKGDADAGDRTEIVPRQLAMSVRAKWGANPAEIIDQVADHVEASGFQRSLQDRFIVLDPETNDGYNFEVILGISRHNDGPGDVITDSPNEPNRDELAVVR